MGQCLESWAEFGLDLGTSSAQELLSIAGRLQVLAATIASGAGGPAEPERVDQAKPISDEVILRAVQAHIACRKRRGRHFGSAVLGEPAWDMLLELFVSAAQGRRLSTSSLCLASGVPSSTALRTIGLLEESGLLTKHRAPDDRRLTVVSITPRGYGQVRSYMTDILGRNETHMSGLSPMRARLQQVAA